MASTSFDIELHYIEILSYLSFFVKKPSAGTPFVRGKATIGLVRCCIIKLGWYAKLIFFRTRLQLFLSVTNQ